MKLVWGPELTWCFVHDFSRIPFFIFQVYQSERFVLIEHVLIQSYSGSLGKVFMNWSNEKLFKWFIDYFCVQFSNNPRFGSSNLNFTLRMIYFFLRRASLFYLWANSLIGLHVISAEHYTVRLTKYTQIVTVVLSKMMRFFKLYRISINDHQKLCTRYYIIVLGFISLHSNWCSKRLLHWYEFLLWTFLHAFHD